MKKLLLAALAFCMMGTAQAQDDQVELNYSPVDEEMAFDLEVNRVVTADQMLCADVIDQYERTGRIYVVANGKDVVPLYGLYKLSKYKSTRCKGRQTTRRMRSTRALDTNNCVFAFYCGQ